MNKYEYHHDDVDPEVGEPLGSTKREMRFLDENGNEVRALVLHAETCQVSVETENDDPSYVSIGMRFGEGGLYTSYSVEDAERFIAGLQRAVAALKEEQQAQ